MRAGDYLAAWAIAERNLRARDPGGRDDPALPYHQRWVWNGQPFHGQHCLVRCYHGLGDTLQFARFLPMLAARAASLTVEMQARLIDMFTGTGGSIHFRPFNEAKPMPPAPCDLEITELCFALRLRPEDAAVPYLQAERGVLPRGCVGLCYGAGDWDAARAVPPILLESICAMAPCVSLMPEPTTLPVLNPGGCPYNMKATAALVAACDLVITVDTMIAHLAGAMGRPVWLMLKAEPDWRWPLKGRRTPWYPSMRLYTPSSAGDWSSLLEDVERDLALHRSKQAKGC